MKHVHTHRLTDEELQRELEAKDTILFIGTDLTWQELESQLERLGFGDSYIVSAMKGTDYSFSRISLRPR
jgi:hypothetical protein